MESRNFHEFENILLGDGYLSILFDEQDQKANTHLDVLDITPDYIVASVQRGYESLAPKSDQVVSAVYLSRLGLYGFHCRCCDKQDNMVTFMRPQSGWCIQRRQFPRTPFYKELQFIHSENKHKGFVVNVCRGGVGFQTDYQLSIGDTILIRFEISPNIVINDLCVIVWGTALPKEDQVLGCHYTYGLKFVNIDSPVLDEIENMAAHFIF